MPVEKLHIKEFLELASLHPVLDVRSPSEYKRAHIPGALNLPLFTDEERKVVGTIYKQESRQAAIKAALDFFGPKMRRMVEDAEAMADGRWPMAGKETMGDDRWPMAGKDMMGDDRWSMTGKGNAANGHRPSAIVLVHCWRGGMRSAGVAWLLDLYGFKVFTLTGGYKRYRNYVLETLKEPFDLKILGGYTGSGKTEVLKELEKRGERIIDLERIACHKGSAFGAIGQPAQPGQEMFENLFCHELRKQSIGNTADKNANPIWLEDESQRIGLVNIPQPLWERMRQSTIFFIDISFEERLNYIVECYGQLDKEHMINAISRIRKRLGGLEMKSAINYLLEDNVKECFRILLKYYDKYYLKGLNNRENRDALVKTIFCEKVDAATNAESVLSHRKSIMNVKVFNNE